MDVREFILARVAEDGVMELWEIIVASLIGAVLGGLPVALWGRWLLRRQGARFDAERRKFWADAAAARTRARG